MNLRKLQNYLQFFRHFRNPFLVFALRLGWVRCPLFLYRLHQGPRSYEMLARPQTVTGSDLFILREVLVEETYREVLTLLGSGPIRLVDLGANLGAATIWLHRAQGLTEAHCFEPDPDSFRLCEFNLRQNGCTVAQAWPQAVGATTREATIFADPDRPAQTSLYRKEVSRNAQTRGIQVISFRDWLSDHPGDFDLLKCDCEGAEWEILETTPEVYRRFKVVVIEVHQNPASQRALAEFPEVLARQGFSTVRWDARPNGLYIGRRLAP